MKKIIFMIHSFPKVMVQASNSISSSPPFSHSPPPSPRVFPCQLSCCEVLLHMIPGLGMITSGFSWCKTKTQLKRLYSESMQGGLYSYMPDENDQFIQRLQVQKTNRAAMFAVNFLISTITSASVFLLCRAAKNS